MGRTKIKIKTKEKRTVGNSKRKIWNNKNKLYARMKELEIMARKEKELNLNEEYNSSKNKIFLKLNERYQELQIEKLYKEKSKNGKVTVNF